MGRVIRADRRGPAVRPAAAVEAAAQAREIRLRAGREEESIRQEARARGLEAANAQAAALLAEATAVRARARAQAEHDIAELALEAAAQLLGETLEAEPRRVLPMVRAMLGRLQRAQRLTVRAHPSDAAALRAALQASTVDAAEGFEVLDDRAITRGGCVIESDIGTLDGRLEVRLAALRRALQAESS